MNDKKQTVESQEIEVSELLEWSEGVQVETKFGPRIKKTAAATGEFWNLWRENKQVLKDAGVSCGKNRTTGEWEVCLWLPVSEEVLKEREEAIEKSRAKSSDFDPPSPEGLEYLPFQRAGIEYAVDRKDVLIADSMGLGKTVQAIGVFNSDESLKSVLIICPASLRLNWKREFEKWSTRKIVVGVVNGGKERDWYDGTAGADVVIVNYDVVGKHRARIDKFSEFDLLIVDEAHYLKNQKAQRTKNILGEKGVGAIKATRKLFLTGTPIENRPVELWSLVQALDPEGLGRNFFAFAKRYCGAHKKSAGRKMVWDFSGASNLTELQERLRSSIMVRRLKEDVLTELPAKRRQVIELPANGASKLVQREQEAWRDHEDTIDELRAKCELSKASDKSSDYEEAIENLRSAQATAFTEMAKIRHELGLAKVKHAVDHIEESLESGPVICFTHHRDVLEAIEKEFRDKRIGVVSISGGASMDDRQAAVDDFQAGEAQLFVGTIGAAGVGLTLTKSSHVVFVELDYVPGRISQAEDRAHRIGQENSVLVQHLVFDGSLDVSMAKTLISKQQVIDSALDDMMAKEPVSPAKRQPATVKLSRNKIQELSVNLSPEQVAAAHEAVKLVSSYCDGAGSLDGMGFSKVDVRIGKSLAMQKSVTPKQAVICTKLARKYKRQVPAELIAQLGSLK